jgi:hypothetical protein
MDDICECPKCGRQHRNLGFGKPPAPISESSIALQALRQIRSLDERNVTKYAQVIARDALARIEKHE